MYIESGLGKVNPYANAENPELRDVGDGDKFWDCRRMMEACAAMGCGNCGLRLRTTNTPTTVAGLTTDFAQT